MVDIDVFSSKNLKTLQQFYLSNPHCLHQFTDFVALFDFTILYLKLRCREHFWLQIWCLTSEFWSPAQKALMRIGDSIRHNNHTLLYLIAKAWNSEVMPMKFYFYMQEHFQIPVKGCRNVTSSEAMTNFKNKMERYKIKTTARKPWSPSTYTVPAQSV